MVRKKLLSLFLAVTMLVTMLPAELAAAGPEAITSLSQVTDMKGSYKLTADVTLTGPHTPIGTESAPFTGTFDGGGHKVTLAGTGEGDYTGLFGYVGAGGTVKNTVVAGEVTGKKHVGGIAGYSAGTLENCRNEASVTSTNEYAGGIAGEIKGTEGAHAIVRNCANTGDIKGTDPQSARWIAGIAGSSTYGEMENCRNTGAVDSRRQRGGSQSGGIVGKTGSAGLIRNCYTTGPVTFKASGTGGISGWLLKHQVENCYVLKGSAEKLANGNLTPEVRSQILSKTEEELKDAGFAKLMGDAFEAVEGDYPLLSWEAAAKEPEPTPAPVPTPAPAVWDGKTRTQPAGRGTADEPYLLADGANLAWFVEDTVTGSHAQSCARLTADIDLGGYDAGQIYGGTTTEEVYDDWAEEWTEETVEAGYAGTFDGAGHVIRGYQSTNGGLFRSIQGATIRDLGLEGTVEAGYGGGLVDGTLAGAASTLENCFSRVTMTVGSNSGGLVGNCLNGDVAIRNCYYVGRLTPKNEYAVNIGGLVGNLADSTLENCYTDYSVLAGKGTASKITNSFYQGSGSSLGTGLEAEALKGKAAALGAAFAADTDNVNGGYPILSWEKAPAGGSGETEPPAPEPAVYAVTFRLEPADAVLTLAGAAPASREGGTVVYQLADGSYPYTVEAEGYVTVSDTLVVAGRPAAPIAITLEAQSTDPEPSEPRPAGPVWDGKTRTQPAGRGTADEPYLLADGANLAWFGAETAKGKSDLCARLTADIDLGGHHLDAIIGGTETIPAVGDWEDDEVSVLPYTGTFDGDGHVIRGYCSDESKAGKADYLPLAGGLFYTIKGATIRELGLEGTSNATGDHLGGLVNESVTGAASTIESCYVKVDMAPGANSGGIIGHAGNGDVAIRNCYYAGRLEPTADINIGGIVGFLGTMSGSTVENCYTTYPAVAGQGSVSAVTNSFYQGSGSLCGTGVSAETLKGKAAALGAAFAADTDNINGGYPILSWQVREGGGSGETEPPAPTSYTWTLTVAPAEAAVEVKAEGQAALTADKQEADTVAGLLEAVRYTYSLKNGVEYTVTAKAEGYFDFSGKVKPDGKAPDAAVLALDEIYTLTFAPTPANAVIVLKDGAGRRVEPVEGSPLVYQIPDGVYTYTASAPEYVSETEGSIDTAYFSKNAFTETVTLRPVLYRIGFVVPTPKEAVLTVRDSDGRICQPVSLRTYELPRGSYTWELALEGYVTQRGSFDVSTMATLPGVTLARDENRRKVTFAVTGSDSCTVTLTGAASGALIRGEGLERELSAGSYDYRITAPGCAPAGGSFTVSDSPLTVEAALSPALLWDGGDQAEQPAVLQLEGRSFYDIRTPAQLVWFARQVSGGSVDINGQLNANIDLGGHPWSRIGQYDAKFNGIFDGNGHTVSGLADDEVGGLFFAVDRNGVVKNLTVFDDSVNSTNGFGGGKMGAVCGENYGLIENCDVYVNMQGGGSWLGGVAAINNSSGRIAGCSAHGAITTTLSSLTDYDYAYAGGIAGLNRGTIENCYSTAAIRETGSSQGGLGGIAGGCTVLEEGQTARVKNCYAAGIVRGNRNAGALVGYTDNAAGLVNSFALDACAAAPVGNLPRFGEVRTAEELRADAFVVVLSGDGSAFRKAASAAQNRGFPVLARQGGLEPDLSQIDGWSELQAARNKLVLRTAEDVTLEADREGNYPIRKPETLVLPAAGDGGVTITWSCSDPQRIDIASGAVTLPEEGISEVTLTAALSITKDGGPTLKDTRIFPVKIHSLAASQQQLLEQIRGELNGELSNLFFRPQWNKNDRNVVTMLEELLEDKGYTVADGETAGDYDLTVTLKDPGRITLGNRQKEYIAADGTITYFYEDPNTWTAVTFAQVQDMVFTLSLGDRSVEITAGANIPWDVDKVMDLMDPQIRALTWEDIRGENTNTAVDVSGQDEAGRPCWPWGEEAEGFVTKDLILPRFLDSFPYGQIRWTCFKPNLVVTQVSSDVKAPLEGRVALSEQDTRVTLTAELIFSLTDGVYADEPEIMVYKTFDFVVKGSGLKPEEEGLLRLEGYPALLRDFTDKDLAVDPDAVANDLQLPIPAELEAAGILDRDTERIRVVSSDENLMEVNGYHAVIYRPLPGAEARTVTYTVSILDRSTNVVKASKDFTLTVRPLTQEEIREALDLMEQVKAAYFQGIRGENTDARNILTDLNGFSEAIPTPEGGLEFLRGAAAIQFRGIMTDDIPGYDPMAGQSWRLFRSSRPTVIEDEVLRVHRQEYDTAVTVDSVLTHGVYGKYWEKFGGTNLAPAYAQFEQLYRQPVSAELTVRGTAGAQNPDPEPQSISVTVTIDGGGTEGFAGLVSYPVSGLEPYTTTAWDVLRMAMTANGYTWEGSGGYVSAVTDRAGVKLDELEHGRNSGWMYNVNGEAAPDKTLNQYYMEEGDALRFFYTADYEQEELAPYEPVTPVKPHVDVRPAGSGQLRVTVVGEPEKTLGGYRITFPAGEGGVYYLVDAQGRETLLQKVVVREGMATALVPGSCTVRILQEEHPFRDVAAGSWYEEYVELCVSRGLFLGTGEERFEPDAAMTRAMLATVLWRMEGQPAAPAAPFADVSRDSWYAEAVDWAFSRGIVLGRSADSFAPEAPVTREEIAAMLCRYAETLGMDMSASGSVERFPDRDSIHGWAREALEWSVGSGLMQGHDTGLLAPLDGTTRAECAALLMRIIGLMLR